MAAGVSLNGGEPESTCNRYRSGVSARTANARFVADRRDRGRRAFAGARAPRGLPLFDRPPFDVEQHLEVLHNSGHSPGSIALWGEASGVLLSGDTVHDGLLVTDAWHSSIDDYVLSTERLLALPVRVAHGGHFRSFGRDRFRSLVQALPDGHRT